MDRRKFTKSIAATAALPLWISTPERKKKKARRIKPKRLLPGATIGLIAPASGIKPGQLETAMQQMEALGYEIRIGKHANDHNGFLAGLDKERVSDIHSMLRDDDIDALWCIRGGYGLSRIVSDFKKKYFRTSSKINYRLQRCHSIKSITLRPSAW